MDNEETLFQMTYKMFANKDDNYDTKETLNFEGSLYYMPEAVYNIMQQLTDILKSNKETLETFKNSEKEEEEK